MRVLRFNVDDTRYAIAIERIVEVAPRVLMSPLAGAPDFVEGAFSFRQAACIAVSLRRRLGHPTRAPMLDDHVLVVRGRRRLLGLVVDRAEGDEMIDDARIESPSDVGGHIGGVVAMPDGVLLIQDVDAMLSDAEEHALDVALETEGR